MEVDDIGFIHMPAINTGFIGEHVVCDCHQGTIVMLDWTAVGLFEVPTFNVGLQTEVFDQQFVIHIFEE
jgi:hypothetical protein